MPRRWLEAAAISSASCPFRYVRLGAQTRPDSGAGAGVLRPLDESVIGHSELVSRRVGVSFVWSAWATHDDDTKLQDIQCRDAPMWCSLPCPPLSPHRSSISSYILFTPSLTATVLPRLSGLRTRYVVHPPNTDYTPARDIIYCIVIRLIRITLESIRLREKTEMDRLLDCYALNLTTTSVDRCVR